MKPRNLSAHPGTDAFPSVSSDGRWIYFSSNRAGGDHVIWKVPSSGGDSIRVTNSVGHAALASSDGAYLYYVESIDKPSGLWRLPVSGGAAVKVLEGVGLLGFAVTDGGIYYVDRSCSQPGVNLASLSTVDARLQYLNFATGSVTTVARNLGNVGLGLTASSDGRTILYSRVDASVDDLMLVENLR